MYRGIDVSKHQGKIDWKAVKENSLVDFAIIRAGYGQNTVDERFYENVLGCIENNIPFGAYWFIYAVNNNETLANACKFHEVIAPYAHLLTMGVWSDFEYDTDTNANKRGKIFTKKDRTDMVLVFDSYLANCGFKVGNYANPDYLQSKFEYARLKDFPLWLAHYVSNSAYVEKYKPEMWQCTSKGSVPGIKGSVDVNFYYGELEGLQKVEAPKENASSVPGSTKDTHVIDFQRAANADGYRDSKGRELKEDGIDGENTTYVKNTVVLKAKKVLGVLMVGSRGELVKFVQSRCNEILGTNYKVDGKYGKDTHKMVKAVQDLYNLSPDGVVGRNTFSILMK